MKQPYLLRGNVKFGPKNDDTSTAADGNASSVEFELSANILPESSRLYDQLGETKANGATQCPREILRFSPPPQNRYCDQSIYRDLTTIHDYGLNVSFANVSGRCPGFYKLMVYSAIRNFRFIPLDFDLKHLKQFFFLIFPDAYMD